ncbi:acid phosphatase [Tolypocladium capitatum]|uniref:Acid phosphatase n=1 Tax=Tolypocladium capitatum TaxID=45235 RepID=A0A2K3QJ81_9HYPO|nr:acid phosphatase [Tolypocladium capitatum]
MLFQTASLLLATAGLAVASVCKPVKPSTPTTVWETQYTATGAADVAKAAATAKTSSPTSNVKGKAFDRLAIIYFENQNYAKAHGDPNFQWFMDKGITLTNFFAVTHPSQPNYMAAIAGDYFGMDDDSFDRAPLNVSTVIDLLESGGISWAHYQEDMPYSGFEGQGYANQENGANDYMRKHNPAILHDSVTHHEQRLSQIKNLSMTDTSRSMFHRDLKANRLPQWMFITPNMTSDGHDTSVTTAGEWCRGFLEPLLSDENFMQNTLVLVTWDEIETYPMRNNILGILLGDAVPEPLVGTSDDNFYNHYSEIATVSANWDLPTLGRWDVGANVFAWVAQKTGDELRQWSSDEELQGRYWNSSYAGLFNSRGGNSRIPAPNLELDRGSSSGRRILQSIKDTWADSDAPTYYEDTIEVPDGRSPPPGYAPRH